MTEPIPKKYESLRQKNTKYQEELNLSGKLKDIINMLQEIEKKLPSGIEAKIERRDGLDFGDFDSWDLVYYVDETDEELWVRIKMMQEAEAKYRANKEKNDRKEYERLKKKYEKIHV